MSSNHHTPLQNDVANFSDDTFNGPLGELDQAITNLHDFDMHFMRTGQPDAGEVLLKIKARRPFTIPAALTGSGLDAGTAATASASCSVQKNGVEFGTMTIAAAGTSATPAAASTTSFAVGDILTVLAPVSQDATLADLYGAIMGVRS